MSRKASAIANVAAVLDADGVLFGASVLGRSGHHSNRSRGRYCGASTPKGGFDNLDDSEAGLREILATSFSDVEVQAVGSVAYVAVRLSRSVVSSPAARSAAARA